MLDGEPRISHGLALPPAHDRRARRPAQAVAEGVVKPHPGSRPRTWWTSSSTALLSLIGIVGLATSFHDLGWLLAGVGGLLVGTGAALAARALRLGALLTVALALVAYLLFGSAFAVPSQAIAHVIPTLTSVASLGHRRGVGMGRPAHPASHPSNCPTTSRSCRTSPPGWSAWSARRSPPAGCRAAAPPRGRALLLIGPGAALRGQHPARHRAAVLPGRARGRLRRRRAGLAGLAAQHGRAA